MNGQPDVSVLMPMQNAEAFVAEALNSVLSQQGVDLEVLVVDDGSTDGSRAAVERIGDPRVRLLAACGIDASPLSREEQGRRSVGVARAFNAGLASARAPLIVRCDADDRFSPGRLAWQLEWLNRHTEFGAVCGGFSTMTRTGRLLSDMETGRGPCEITDELHFGETRTHFCTFAVRTQVLRSIGGCRSYFVTSSDIDLQLRVGHACRVWYEPRGCYLYRLHGHSITHTRKSAERLFFDGAARRFSRQRSLTGTDDLDRGTAPAPPGDADSRPLRVSDQVQELLRGRAWKEHRQGRKLRAIWTGIRACAVQPGKPSIWKSLAALVLKQSRGMEPKHRGTAGATESALS